MAISVSTLRLYLQSSLLAPEKFRGMALYFTERQGGLGLRPAHV